MGREGKKRAKLAPRLPAKKASSPATSFSPGFTGKGKLTPEVQQQFLALYASGTHSVDTAAAACGVSHVAIYYLRRRDKHFETAFNEAQELNLDALEAALHKKALFGDYAHPGNLTAIFGVLRAKRAQVYRENMNLTGRLENTFAASWAAAVAERQTQEGSHDRDQPATH